MLATDPVILENIDKYYEWKRMKEYWSEQEVFDALESAVSSGEPSDDLVSYLKDFQQDKLTTGTQDRPPSFYMQSVGVMTIIANQLESQGRHQVIKQINVPATSPTPNFLSVIAAMCYVTNELELNNNIGYSPMVIEAGIKSHSKVGYAEIIVNDELAQKLITPQHQDSGYNARVIMQGSSICVEYGASLYAIANLAENGTYYKFMEYVTSPNNKDILIRLEDIKGIEGLASTKDLTERVRFSGFNKGLKDAFFPTCKQDKVLFRNTTILDAKQAEAMKRQASKAALKKS